MAGQAERRESLDHVASGSTGSKRAGFATPGGLEDQNCPFDPGCDGVDGTGREESKMKATYSVILQPDPAGGYFVSIPAFKNGFTQAETFEEALENAREVIELLLEDCAESGAEPPAEAGLALAVGLEVELPARVAATAA